MGMIENGRKGTLTKMFVYCLFVCLFIEIGLHSLVLAGLKLAAILLPRPESMLPSILYRVKE